MEALLSTPRVKVVAWRESGAFEVRPPSVEYEILRSHFHAWVSDQYGRPVRDALAVVLPQVAAACDLAYAKEPSLPAPNGRVPAPPFP